MEKGAGDCAFFIYRDTVETKSIELAHQNSLTTMTMQAEIMLRAQALCNERTQSLRAELEQATNEKGEGIVSTNGRALTLATSADVRRLIQAVTKTFNEQRKDFKAVSEHRLQIDLSYLFIPDLLTFSDQRIQSFCQMGLNFEGCVFEIGADFSTIELLHGDVNFNHAHFVGPLIANAIRFYEGQERIDFAFCRFSSTVKLDGAQFDRATSFQQTIFEVPVSLANTQFKSDATFSNARFLGDAVFNKARFMRVDFSETTFSSAVSFNNAIFQDRTDFRRSRFSFPPSFHQANLHPDTSFSMASFASFDTESDWRAYRTLKLIMGSFRAAEEEGRFFAYENRTRCKILLKENWFSVTGNLSRLYDIISEYGENIARPIVWLFVVTTYFSAWFYVLGGINTSSQQTSWLTDMNPAAGLALQNLVNPLGLFSKSAPFIVSDVWVAVLSILQSVFSLSVVALLLLAIRRRFHKGGGQ